MTTRFWASIPMADSPVLLQLIRHGEPVGGRRFRGHGIDDPLSECGWAQMRSATADMGNWDRIISSPMSRCHEFATELAAGRGIPLQVDERLREVGFGRWEGLDHDQVQQRYGDEYRDFYLDPFNNRPHGAEPLQEFARRVEQALQEMVARHPGQRILVVCHAGVIRAAIATTLHMPLDTMYRIKVSYAAVASLRFYGREGSFASLC